MMKLPSKDRLPRPTRRLATDHFGSGTGYARILLLLATTLAAAAAPKAAEFRAGTSAIKITPSKPIWMSGYGDRNHPSEGVLTDLWAKALAIEDKRGTRIVIVSTDLLGLTRSITDQVSARAQKQWNIDRANLLFNSSHTHTGPVIKSKMAMFELEPGDQAVVDEYTRDLVEKLYTAIGSAMADLEPATLRYSIGTAKFSVNRRQFTPNGVILGVQPDGPVDHGVPVLEVRKADGSLKTILFGYACHNTTLNHYKISGDYAGFAQIEVQKKYPGVNAMFLLLCGGDQNPNPRRSDALAMQHGASLASGVAAAVDGNAKQDLKGRLRAAFQFTDLAFRVHTREDFEKETKHASHFNRLRAKVMLAGYDNGHPVRTLAYPVQAIRLGDGPVVVALGGEVVIDYAIRARKEFQKEKLVVAGYSNDVACYIPSKRVLGEGGYEADFSMVYYGQPGPFADDVEERIFGTMRRVMRRIGAK